MQNISFEITDKGIGILRFDRPGSAANIFDRETLVELDGWMDEVDKIERADELRGLILISAKEGIFIAGADLHALETLDGEALNEFIELGQKVFMRIAKVRAPTAAAIHGACVGGGYEVALACDYRVATDARYTRIGLPEVSLGILPAWGGSTRLPRLIGLPGALDVILAGKVLAAKQALRRGLVDMVIPREQLMQAALLRIARGKRTVKLPIISRLPALNRVIAWQARKKILARTRGNYPAPLKALEVVSASVERTLEESLALERRAVAELSRTEACRNLLRVFQLQERSKKLRVPVDATGEKAPASGPIRRVGVIGAGVMGASIAQWISARGIGVMLRDIDPARVGAGMARIDGLYREGVKRHLFTRQEARDGMDRIRPAAGDTPLADIDLVIEAAVEKLDLKKKIFSGLGAAARPDAILATNTSALPLSEIAAATEHPERVVGLHFFNPVHRMQLVEVVAGRMTSAAATDAALRFVQKIGKLPVLVRDSPGFLVNRILLPYMVEAGRLFDAGESVESIDGCMLDFGMPMGPLRLVDEVGVDISVDVARTLSAAFPGRMETPRVLEKMLDGGLLGRKTGAGFYIYGEGTGSRGEELNPAVGRLRAAAAVEASSREEIQKKLVLLMINEAARCLEEGVVENASDVDLAMVLGAGFAPFRGGPLAYADARGIGPVEADLEKLGAAPGGERYKPCALIREMAETGKEFYEN